MINHFSLLCSVNLLRSCFLVFPLVRRSIVSARDLSVFDIEFRLPYAHCQPISPLPLFVVICRSASLPREEGVTEGFGRAKHLHTLWRACCTIYGKGACLPYQAGDSLSGTNAQYGALLKRRDPQDTLKAILRLIGKDLVPETMAAAECINQWFEEHDPEPGTPAERGVGFGDRVFWDRVASDLKS